MTSPGEALVKAAKLFQERNAVYGDAYLKVGPIMEQLFPAGMELKTAADHNRYHLLVLMVVKMTRYAPNFATGHPDSMDDIMVYAAMMQSLDNGRDDDPDCLLP